MLEMIMMRLCYDRVNLCVLLIEDSYILWWLLFQAMAMGSLLS